MKKSTDKNSKNRTLKTYNLFLHDCTKTDGYFEMPSLDSEDEYPKNFIGFNEISNSTDEHLGVHFYLDDYQFERVWKKPNYYLEKIKRFKHMLTPDFSLFVDMPIATQIWNVYRSRLIGQYFQKNGLAVIPTVCWSTSDSFTFCFDGLPHNSIVSISSVGVMKNKLSKNLWIEGVEKMIETIKPKTILIYGEKIDFPFGDVEIIHIPNTRLERIRKHGRQRC